MPAEPPDESSGAQQVEITVMVVPGRIRTLVTRLIANRRIANTRLVANRRLRAVLIAAAVLAVLSAGGIVIAVTSSTKAARRPLWAQALPGASHLNGLGDSLFTRFRIQSSCPRVTAVSRDRTYVRVDFEHTGRCGVYGNTVALVLRRAHNAWWPKFEASTWICPISTLPAGVAAQLGLCARTPAR